MLDRLRQVAFLVKDLEDAKDMYRRYLGMESCHSEDLSRYGLKNAVIPVGGGTFMKVSLPPNGSTAISRSVKLTWNRLVAVIPNISSQRAIAWSKSRTNTAIWRNCLVIGRSSNACEFGPAGGQGLLPPVTSMISKNAPLADEGWTKACR
jgi:hypothetical protein